METARTQASVGALALASPQVARPSYHPAPDLRRDPRMTAPTANPDARRRPVRLRISLGCSTCPCQLRTSKENAPTYQVGEMPQCCDEARAAEATAERKRGDTAVRPTRRRSPAAREARCQVQRLVRKRRVRPIDLGNNRVKGHGLQLEHLHTRLGCLSRRPVSWISGNALFRTPNAA
jgi:hypothetical protein